MHVGIVRVGHQRFIGEHLRLGGALLSVAVLLLLSEDVRAAEPNEMAVHPVATPALVAKSTWQELAAALTQEYGGILAEVHESSTNVVERTMPVQDRFVAVYSLIANNRSSEASLLVASPALPLTVDDIASWDGWTSEASSGFPTSPKIDILRADAIARLSGSTNSLAWLAGRNWGTTAEATDVALREYLIAILNLSHNLRDVNGRGPARAAFEQSLNHRPLSAVHTDFGYYYLSAGHTIPSRAAAQFSAATNREPGCVLAEAGIARINQDTNAFVAALGVVNKGFSLNIGGQLGWGMFKAGAVNFGFSRFTSTDPNGGLYGVGPENIDLTEPLSNVWSTLSLQGVPSQKVGKQ